MPTTVPAAWYPDPAGTELLRWWDGADWTNDTTAPLVQSPEPEPAWGSWQPSSVAEAPAYQPMGSFVPAASSYSYEVVKGSALTIWVWLLAVLPLALVVILELRLTASGIIYLGPVGLYVTFALLDRRALVERGYEAAPNQWWILLAPVYFILRAVKTRPVSWAPFGLWVIATVVASILISTTILGMATTSAAVDTVGQDYSGLTPPYSEADLDYLLTPEGMSEQIQADYGLTFEDFSCLPLESTEVSATTICGGTYQGTTMDMTVQVVARDPGSAPFYITSTTASSTGSGTG